MAATMQLAGWGRYPVAECAVTFARDLPAVPAQLAQIGPAIARGNGRSYGDASLNPAGTLAMTGCGRLLAFDPATGLLECEGGALLADIVATFLPRGWFVPVTPGTRFVTVGGMIAADVHGKNHHGAGSFCAHVDWLDLAIGEGRVLRCSHTENADLFAATCGGMGLTGVVLRAAFRLIPVKSAAMRQKTVRAANIAAAIETFEATLDWTYSVGWIDCLASGASLGRSAIMLGEHAHPYDLPAAQRQHPFAMRQGKPKRIPLDFPDFALSRPSVKVFNQLYHALQQPGDAVVGALPYFYPLDAVLDWNRIYGKRGFVQFQCVLPLAASLPGLTQILTDIAANGQASFLAVLKRMGPQGFGLLSFPMEGYTLALDFPANEASFALVDRLTAITRDHGGRVYLAKDARLDPAAFANGYPRLDQFRSLRAAYGLDTRFTSLLSRRLEI
jgi:FAD/FMN-containing dehydrogenase